MRRKALVISILLHAALIIVVYVFQGMIFPYLRLYGYAPLILPVVSTGVAVYEGQYTGGVVGIFSGILCDISLNQPAGVFTVLLTITGLLIGTLADTVVTRRLATFLISSAAVLSISALVQLFPLWYFTVNGVQIPFQPLLSTAIRQTAYSLVFVFPLWFFVKALGARAGRMSSSGRSF